MKSSDISYRSFLEASALDSDNDLKCTNACRPSKRAVGMIGADSDGRFPTENENPAA